MASVDHTQLKGELWTALNALEHPIAFEDVIAVAQENLKGKDLSTFTAWFGVNSEHLLEQLNG